jgi:hypothetical protein
MSVAFVPFYRGRGIRNCRFFVILSASLSVLEEGLAAREAVVYLGTDNEEKYEIATLLRTIEVKVVADEILFYLRQQICTVGKNSNLCIAPTTFAIINITT